MRARPLKGASGLGGHHIRATQIHPDQGGLWASSLVQWSAQRRSRVPHEVKGLRQPTSPSCWPGCLSLGPDVQECGGWASRSNVLGMSPRSSSAQSRSGRRCVTFIYWRHNVFALPCPSEPAQGVGVAALEAALGIFLFFLLFCKWVFNSVAQKTNYCLLLSAVNFDTTGNNCKSRGPQLNFQADSSMWAPALG